MQVIVIIIALLCSISDYISPKNQHRLKGQMCHFYELVILSESDLKCFFFFNTLQIFENRRFCIGIHTSIFASENSWHKVFKIPSCRWNRFPNFKEFC